MLQNFLPEPDSSKTFWHLGSQDPELFAPHLSPTPKEGGPPPPLSETWKRNWNYISIQKSELNLDGLWLSMVISFTKSHISFATLFLIIQ